MLVGYTARLGQDEQHPGVLAHVGIAVEPKRSRDVVLRLQAIPELRQLYAVSGEADLIAVLRAASTARLDVLLDEIGETDGVRKTTTSVVLAVRVDRDSRDPVMTLPMPDQHDKMRPLVAAYAGHSPGNGCACRLDRPGSGARLGPIGTQQAWAGNCGPKLRRR